MGSLTLEQASIIVDAALEKGAELGFKPLTVVVLDDGGNMKAIKRQDGASPFRPQVALGKAWGAVGMGTPSRFIEKQAQERPYFVNSLAAASGGRLVPVAGGVLIRDAEGTIIGSVGISGDISDNDEISAIAGIKAAGLTSDPEA
ncbi:MAG: heme-binding protein [Deltaproteobacteria bacterium]|nr:heme-binding protein [Deltaproteobacteria bacterium]